ncbi:LysR family transcriptional regulator [Marinobacter lutaoensis]|uniref:LysR family transcriptional regulator n=1 Tax=Marinobacter lutaoensis TaxID=135739 RepID=A0A1V2DTS5_9GAMM|nr:LysR family transcriptional regulator [Marinobacter lutaoensis]MBE02126.1 LysR family transcriptional regulator [Marinobacter sp.]MBI42432.1 LysR family transcriptional regulator [Oceanospirillales bacterium]NVD35517.1 LysR family transcriptional regulator [Marinobacter lutaoensis]ONF44083.1 LysR family transcriptional regulator [Marinobacter lutaoensis]
MKLNYHHLYYFWTVARLGHLTRAAESLHVSQSALSGQIRKLEESLGHDLFIREGRRLKLSEAGRVAFGYAEEIFRQGEELAARFRSGAQANREVLKIGAVATLSRNFQEGFLRPLLGRRDLELKLQSGSLDDLLRRLSAHRLDLILSNQPVTGDEEHPWRSRRLARQPVSVIGPQGDGGAVEMPRFLHGQNLIVPGPDNHIRQSFDQFCEYHGIYPNIIAEVDDMAMMRLLTRDSGHFAVLPPVVVRDELRQGVLRDYGALPGVYEEFYAISIRRQFQPALVTQLLAQPAEELLTLQTG